MLLATVETEDMKYYWLAVMPELASSTILSATRGAGKKYMKRKVRCWSLESPGLRLLGQLPGLRASLASRRVVPASNSLAMRAR